MGWCWLVDGYLQEELARRRREWNERREKERQEQEDLREHEAEVVEWVALIMESLPLDCYRAVL